MQLIKPRRRAPVGVLAGIAGSTMLGALFVAGGLFVSYLALTTPVIAEWSAKGGHTRMAPLLGALVWGLAFLVPGVLLVIGFARLARATDRALDLRTRRRPAASLRRRLSNEYSVAQAVNLPDGRILPEVVIGPHGLMLVAELPPPRFTRVSGQSWEVRLDDGRWVPIENPVERAARDAERLRNWITHEEEDFSPRTYAAVIGDGHEVARTPQVAVVPRKDLPDLLRALPPARQMTAERRQRLEEMFRSAS